jgi:glucoamylase
VPGNPWFVCTLWLAEWYSLTAKKPKDLKQALDILEWVAAHALPSGILAEQVDPYTDQPVSVSPLTWSHAAYVSTVLTYLQCKTHLEAS